MLDMGLNPYGLSYHLGLQGHGTPRTNPDGRGLEGFLALAEELGVTLATGWPARSGRCTSGSRGGRRTG